MSPSNLDVSCLIGERAGKVPLQQANIVKEPVGLPPTVVNIGEKELNKGGYRNIQEWLDAEDCRIYIGRMVQDGPSKGLPESKWKNHNNF